MSQSKAISSATGNDGEAQEVQEVPNESSDGSVESNQPHPIISWQNDARD